MDKSKIFLLVSDGTLGHDPWRPLRELSESGPGYQLVEIGDDWPKETYVVLNCELLVSLKGCDPADVLRQLPSASSYAELLAKLTYQTWTTVQTPSLQPTPPRTTRLVHTKTTHGEKFYRLSAYSNDRRLTHDRQFLPGTFVVTESDIDTIGSGLAAVGRYALPTALPATYAYEIEPEPGTDIELGTVRPAYGQSGGGVEGLFLKGTGAWSVKNHIRVLPAW